MSPSCSNFMYCLSTFSAPKLCLPPGSTAFGNTTLRPLPPLALSSTNRIVGTSLPANSLIRRSSVRQRTESLMPKRVRSFLAKAKRFGPESGPATGTLLIIVLTVLLMSASGDVAVLPLASAAALGDGGEALAGLSPQLAGIESPSFTWIQLDDEEGLPAPADPCRPAEAAGNDSPLRCWAPAAPASEPLLLQKRLGQVSKLRSLCDARTQITSHSLTSRRRFQTETSQATAT